MDVDGRIVRYVTTEELAVAQRRESYAPVREPSFDIATHRLRGLDLYTERVYVLLAGEPDPDPWESIAAIAKALHIERDVLAAIDAVHEHQ